MIFVGRLHNTVRREFSISLDFTDICKLKSLRDFQQKGQNDKRGRIEREPQGFFLAFEIGNFLDSRTSDFWCSVFLKGGKNGKRVKLH